jgi:CRP/FNR family transcriptional regulator
MSITIENISRLCYFNGVESDKLAMLPPLFNSKSFIKGQSIVSEGDKQENLHFVNAGVVKVYKTSSEGKEQIIKIVRPGESFNDVAVFGDSFCPYSAQALGNTTIFTGYIRTICYQ